MMKMKLVILGVNNPRYWNCGGNGHIGKYCKNGKSSNDSNNNNNNDSNNNNRQYNYRGRGGRNRGRGGYRVIVEMSAEMITTIVTMIITANMKGPE